LLHTLLEHVPEGITIAAGPPDFPIRANSRFALKLMGRPKESMLGMPAGEHVYAFGVFRADGVTRPAPEEMPLYRASRHGETVTDEEWVMERPDGTKITVLQNVTPIRDEAGQILGAISCWRDISERKRVEDDLRRAAALLDLTHESILVLDFSGAIIFWNRGATEMYGWPPEEALGQVAYRLLKTRFPQPFEDIKTELLRNHRWEGDLAQTRRDGSSLVVSSRWALQRDAHGQPLAILEINFDITRRGRGPHHLTHPA
jgi:PAS domain S-box-containing protein